MILFMSQLAKGPAELKSTAVLAWMLTIALCAFLVFQTPAQAERRLALVVGNDAYQNVTKLQKAVNDAKGMGETLKELGFEVTIAINTSRRAMNRTLQDFTNSIEPDDIVMFFYAGHGVEIDGENYLLPIDVPDANSDQLDFIKSETIRLNTLLANLRQTKSRLNLVVLDACRNNPFSKTAGRSLGSDKGLARIAAPQGTFVIYSADVGETALDRLSDSDANPNSVFTRTLIPLMLTPGIDLVDTAREARRQVRKLALSVSHEQTPAYYDAVLGDFFFTPASISTPQITSQVVKPPLTQEVTPNSTPIVKTTEISKPNQQPIKNNRETAPPEIDVALLTNPKEPSNIRPNVSEDELSNQDLGPVPALVVTAGEKDLIRLWNADTMSLLAELSGEKKLITTIKLTNKGRSLLVAGKDGSVVTYSLPSFKKISAYYPDFEVSVIGEANDGTIMMGGTHGLLAAFNPKTLTEIRRRQAHDGIVSPIIARANSVLSASADGAIVTTDVKSGREINRVHTIANGKITDFVFVSDTIIVAAHEKGEVSYIDVSSGQILSAFQGHNGWISSVDITPNRRAIVTAGVNGNLRYWPIGSSKLSRSVPAHSDVASGAKFLNAYSGNLLASVGFDGKLKFWLNNDNRQVAEFKHGPAIVFFDYISTQ